MLLFFFFFCKMVLNYKHTDRKARLFVRGLGKETIFEANVDRRVTTEFAICPIS